MDQTDFKLIFNSSTKILCSQINNIDGVYQYCFNLFPSGLELRLESSIYYSNLTYAPADNVIYNTQMYGPTTLEFSAAYLHSYGYKVYTLAGYRRVGSGRMYDYVTIHKSKWDNNNYSDDGYETAHSGTSSGIEPGESITYHDEYDWPAIRLNWYNSKGVLYTFLSLTSIVFIEYWLWTWQEIPYYSSLDKTHYPIIKVPGTTDRDEYYDASTSYYPIVGQVRTFLSYTGDCYTWTNDVTGTILPKLDNGLATRWAVSYALFNASGPAITNSSNPQLIAADLPFFREPRQPKKINRRYTGRLGVQGAQMSYVPYTNIQNDKYKFGDAGDKLITTTAASNNTTPISISNPWVLFDNLTNTDVLDLEGTQDKLPDVIWLDNLHLKVKDKVYLIPPNWKVELYTRKVSSISTPSQYNPKIVYRGTTILDGSSQVGFDSTYTHNDVPWNPTEYTNTTVNINFTEVPCTFTNNWVFSCTSQQIQRNNIWVDIPSAFFDYTNTRNTKVSVDLSRTVDDPYDYGGTLGSGDATMTAYVKISSIESSTNYPIINNSNIIDLYPVAVTTSDRDSDSGNEKYLNVIGSNSFCSYELYAAANTWSTYTDGYLKFTIKWKSKGSGLQPPIVYRTLLNTDNDYKNISRNYHEKLNTSRTRTLECSYAPNVGNVCGGLSFGIQYQNNTSYADTWYYLISYPEA